MIHDKLMEIYQTLFDRFGPQHWWPGETRFEIIIGAILTQNTNWSNVEKAITNLKAANALGPQALYQMDITTLAELIHPSGYYNIKAKRIKSFLGWLFENYAGDVDALAGLPADTLREELLSIKGIGPETADSIVLYAYDKCVFVVDAYTCRIMARHLLLEAGTDYEQTREFFQGNLENDTTLFNEFHALLVRVGKEFCKPKAKCQNCPLENLPHDLDPEQF